MEKGYKRAELEYFLQHHKSYRQLISQKLAIEIFNIPALKCEDYYASEDIMDFNVEELIKSIFDKERTDLTEFEILEKEEIVFFNFEKSTSFVEIINRERVIELLPVEQDDIVYLKDMKAELYMEEIDKNENNLEKKLENFREQKKIVNDLLNDPGVTEAVLMNVLKKEPYGVRTERIIEPTDLKFRNSQNPNLISDMLSSIVKADKEILLGQDNLRTAYKNI